MHLRFVRVQGSPEGAEQRVATFQQQAMPVIRQQPGNAGVGLISDPETGRGGSVSYWETREDLERAEETLGSLRARLTGEMGLQVQGIEDYEVSFIERAQPAAAGTCVRLTRGAATDLDEITRQVREFGLRVVAPMSGFRALICGVDRAAGRFMIASVWNTPDDRRNSEIGIAPVREEMVRTGGVSSIEAEHYDILLADIPARTGVSG